MTHDAVVVVDLELVAELVCSARSVRREWGSRQQDVDDVLLVDAQIGRVERGDHVQTREATAADELELHQTTVASSTLDAHDPGLATERVSGPGP